MHDSSYVDDSCGWDKSLLIFSFREDAKNNQVIKVGLFKYLYLSNTFKSFFSIATEIFELKKIKIFKRTHEGC